MNAEWIVPPELDGRRLDAALKALSGVSWEQGRRLVGRGKVTVDGRVAAGDERVRAGMRIAANPSAPGRAAREARAVAIVHVDAAVVVVDKPPGVSTVPYGDEPPDEQRHTLDALVRAALAKKLGGTGRPPLGVVQRLDKETSGLMVFARTLAAKRHLAQQLRVHSVHRVYRAIAHGAVRGGTFRSRLVANRGDGLRGSTRHPKLGQEAVTHVTVLEALAGATLIACRLETGRTHQIRIHLAEADHPLVGERVYVRGFAGPRIAAPRIMLHAAELGFVHPSSGKELRFTRDPPRDFVECAEHLRIR